MKNIYLNCGRWHSAHKDFLFIFREILKYLFLGKNISLLVSFSAVYRTE